MKPEFIEVGVTYRNARGNQARKVLGRGPEHASEWRQDQDVVLYEVTRGENKGRQSTMTASAFAAWAHRMEYAEDSLTRFDESSQETGTR